jgi:hypothetical protein
MNANLVAYQEGNRFRVEVSAANLMRSDPRFAKTKREAQGVKRTLQESGYRCTVFSITEAGGLVPAR